MVAVVLGYHVLEGASNIEFSTISPSYHKSVWSPTSLTTESNPLPTSVLILSRIPFTTHHWFGTISLTFSGRLSLGLISVVQCIALGLHSWSLQGLLILTVRIDGSSAVPLPTIVLVLLCRLPSLRLFLGFLIKLGASKSKILYNLTILRSSPSLTPDSNPLPAIVLVLSCPYVMKNFLTSKFNAKHKFSLQPKRFLGSQL